MNKHTGTRHLPGLTFLVALIGAALTGCVGGPLTTREKAAGMGALGGAAAGAAIGSAVDRPGTGALIGGALGLGAGALIGGQLQAQERDGPVVIERERRNVVVVERDYSSPAHPKIPPGHLPPPGKCRIWFADRPPGHQPPPADCRVLERRIPPGAYLVRGG